MSKNISTPKGTRDFGPEDMSRRNFIFDTIRSVFQKFGYNQIETPSMENLSTLMGKYGEEGDKLIFKILNSGDYLKNINEQDYQNKDCIKLTPQISEKGLRYDLTVPFARFIVQHQNEIQFPFKRFQIQPVWRADRPQKGRYREFYQCDVDIIGSKSLLNELELTEIIAEIFNLFNIQIVIKLNNRKILAGIAEIIGAGDKLIDITVAIDKLEKIGLDKVNEELASKGLSADAIQKLQPIINLSGSNLEKLAQLEKVLHNSPIGMEGISEIRTLLNYTDINCTPAIIELDITLARGLNYYTGAIFEVKARDVQIGSICGGGRYDDLTGIFGLKDISGVGVSFGADRIYDVLNELNLFPKKNPNSTLVLFTNFGEKEEIQALKLLSLLRSENIIAELYPDAAKLKKQLSYANNKNIPYAILIGEEEMKEGVVTVKNLEKGEQLKVAISDLIGYFKQDNLSQNN